MHIENDKYTSNKFVRLAKLMINYHLLVIKKIGGFVLTRKFFLNLVLLEKVYLYLDSWYICENK